MLGILLIYFIGKRFYDLSDEYDQNKWLYAVLSIVIYYAAGGVFGLILGVGDALFEMGIDWDNSLWVNFIGLPIGLLAVWLFYNILEKKWKKSVVLIKDEIQDIGKDIDN